MRRRSCYLAAVALLALFVIACSIEQADARPLPAHHATPSFTPSHCLDSGVWQTRLHITADVSGGIAHIDTKSTGFDLPMPVDNLFTVSGAEATYTVGIVVRWPDGFVADLGQLTATRPAGGCVPPTTSTTDCAHAVPPKDCTVPTTEVPPSTTTPTTAPTAPPTSAPASVDTSPIATTAPGPSPSISAAQPSRPPSPTPTNRTNLPTTGSSDGPLIVGGLGALLVGAVLLLAVRRRSAS